MYSIVAASIYIPTNSAGGTSSLCPFINCKFFFFFDDGYSDQCNVIPHWSFNFHFSNTEQYWASLHVFVSIYIFSLEKCLFRYSVHFFIGLIAFLILRYMSYLSILEINPLSFASLKLTKCILCIFCSKFYSFWLYN